MVELHYWGKARTKGRGSSSLSRRRRIHLGRRLTASLCLGTAIFFLLQIIGGVVGHTSIILAARPIAPGDRVDSTMIRSVSLPGSWRLPGTFSSLNQPLGQVAYIRIEEGRPLLDMMLGGDPLEPPGTTPVELYLTSSVDSLVPGDQVKILAPGDCQAHQISPPASVERQMKTGPNIGRLNPVSAIKTPLHTSTSEGSAKEQENREPGSCILVEEGLILNLPKPGKEKGLPGRGELQTGQEHSKVVLALKPHEATRILSMNPSVPLIAIRLSRNTQPTPSNLHMHSAEDKYPDNRRGNSDPSSPWKTVSEGKKHGFNQPNCSPGNRSGRTKNITDQQ